MKLPWKDDIIGIMKIEIEESTYVETMNAILSLIEIKECEGIDTSHQWGLLKCLRGILKHQVGISAEVKKDSLGDYRLVVEDKKTCASQRS